MSNQKARAPEDLTRMFVEAANRGDAEAVAELYELDAVMAYPPGELTRGRDAIRILWSKAFARRPHFELEDSLPPLAVDEIALTATLAKDGAGVRVQVVRRQPDGSWLRLIDTPELEQIPFG